MFARVMRVRTCVLAWVPVYVHSMCVHLGICEVRVRLSLPSHRVLLLQVYVYACMYVCMAVGRDRRVLVSTLPQTSLRGPSEMFIREIESTGISNRGPVPATGCGKCGDRAASVRQADRQSEVSVRSKLVMMVTP